MNTILKKEVLFAEDKNTLYTMGYRYYCKTNIRFNGEWDKDYPAISYNFFVSDSKEEAENHALTQKDPYSGFHPDIKEIPKHTETIEEKNLRETKEKEERIAKRHAKETEKAEKLNLTISQYRNLKTIKRIEKEIKELEKEIEKKKARIEYYKTK